MSKIGFIGTGNMASAIIKGIIDKNVFPASDVYICDIDDAKTQSLQQQLSVNVVIGAAELTKSVDIVVLSVKPQIMPVVLESLKESVDSNTVFVSIAAGVTVEKITACLGDAPVIRVMPNTPALVGQGMAGLYANEKAKTYLPQVKAIFSAVGKAIVVEDESLIDAITAVSGSGPAYYFLMMEKMIDAAVALGIDVKDATTLVLQTAAGAAKLASQSQDSPATLRQKVTSPGGTTQAAIEVLEKADFGDAIINAIKQADARSKELSG